MSRDANEQLFESYLTHYGYGFVFEPELPTVNHGDLSVDLLLRLCEVLSISIEHLFRQDDPNPPPPSEDDIVVEAALIQAGRRLSSRELALHPRRLEIAQLAPDRA